MMVFIKSLFVNNFRNGFLQERGLSIATKQPYITSTPKAPTDLNNNYTKNIGESLTSDVDDIHGIEHIFRVRI